MLTTGGLKPFSIDPQTYSSSTPPFLILLQGVSPVRPLGADMWQGLTKIWRGFELIAASQYLMHLCAYIALNSMTSSMFYFERSMVVAAAAGDAQTRTTILASINSMSALVIALLQMLATVSGKSDKHFVGTDRGTSTVLPNKGMQRIKMFGYVRMSIFGCTFGDMWELDCSTTLVAY